MKGFARSPALGGAAVAVAALGLLAGPARREYLVEAGATVNTRGDNSGTVYGSNVTFTAQYAPAPGDPTGSGLSYSWTLAYAHTAPMSYTLTTQLEGDTASADATTTGSGFAQPVVGFFALGSTLYLQLAGDVTPGGAVEGSGASNVSVEVSTATGTVGVLTASSHGLGPVLPPGGLTPVPEPATLALVGVGAGVMLLVPRLRRRLRRGG